MVVRTVAQRSDDTQADFVSKEKTIRTQRSDQTKTSRTLRRSTKQKFKKEKEQQNAAVKRAARINFFAP